MIIATMGLPRSGKSTWCGKQEYPVICPDDFRIATHGEAFNATAEPVVWASIWIAIRALLRRHETIIFDAANTTRKRRDELRRLSKARVYFRVFTAQTSVCIVRAGDNEQLVDVINRMADQWEPLQDDEDVWKG